jgi:predicted dehydrogenase
MVSRRSFLAATTAASFSRVYGANERIGLGLLGAGGRGSYVAELALRPEFNGQMLALSDASEIRMDKATSSWAKGADTKQDFRAVLDRKDIDAVVIGSTDHWHVPMLLAALDAGKDVYIEKPLTKTPAEGQVAIDAVKRAGRIVQVGYQQRSYPHFKLARHLVLDGVLGIVNLVQTYWYQDYRRPMNHKPGDEAKINWKAWLGTAPERPFDPSRFTRWRWYWDYGGGHLTDLFSHWVDSAHWIMNDDKPVHVATTGSNTYFKDLECPDTISLHSQYGKGHVVTYDGSILNGFEDGGLVLRGSEGTMRLKRSGFEIFNRGGKQTYQVNSERDGTIDHMGNFLECVKSRKTPNSDVVSAVAAANAAHQGNAAFRSGARVTSSK